MKRSIICLALGLFVSANAVAETCVEQIKNQSIELPSMKPRPVTAEEQKVIDILDAVAAGDTTAVTGVLADAFGSPFIDKTYLSEGTAVMALNELNQAGRPLTCALLFNQENPSRDVVGNLTYLLVSQFLAAPYEVDVTLTGSEAIQTVIAEQVPSGGQVDAWKKSVPGDWFVTIGNVEKRGIGLKFYVQSQETGIALMHLLSGKVRGLPMDYYVTGKPVGF